MITVDAGAHDHTELTVAAPITVEDLTAAGESLRRLAETDALRRVLIVVDSIGLPAPKALWADLRLASLISDIRWVALITDIEWYARLSELSGTLLPGLTIKHFEPSDASAARSWLAAQD